MTSKPPQRHHYIPEFLLRHFCDVSGRLWVTHSGKTYQTTRTNVFVERDLYVKYNWNHVPSDIDYKEFLSSIEKSNDYEARLGEIESNAAPRSSEDH